MGHRVSFQFMKLFAGLLTVFFVGATFANTIATTPVTIDFTKPVQAVSPLAFSFDVSGYGQGGMQIITRDAVAFRKLKALKPASVRMHLKYDPPGQYKRLVCAGAGCTTNEAGEHWINSIIAIGAIPVLIVDNDKSHSLSQDMENAKRMVAYFNKTLKKPVKRWIIGNEPDNGKMDAATYSRRFNSIYDAMKSVDPTIKIGGPANAYFNQGFLQTFLTQSGSRVDFIDFHQYGQGGDVQRDEATLLSKTVEYRNNILQLRRMVKATPQSAPRASKIEIEVGEWNLDWSGNKKQYSPFATVWGVSVIGQILQAGGISMTYADKNGDLGLLWEKQTEKGVSGFHVNDEMPLYHAIGMYTGEGLFPVFGKSLVKVANTVPDLEIYAATNPKTIIIVNKSPLKSRTVRYQLKGVTGGKATVWQKSSNSKPSSPPVKVSEATVGNGQLILTSPPYSVIRVNL